MGNAMTAWSWLLVVVPVAPMAVVIVRARDFDPGPH